jgi:hypothetical protein
MPATAMAAKDRTDDLAEFMMLLNSVGELRYLG